MQRPKTPLFRRKEPGKPSTCFFLFTTIVVGIIFPLGVGVLLNRIIGCSFDVGILIGTSLEWVLGFCFMLYVFLKKSKKKHFGPGKATIIMVVTIFAVFFFHFISQPLFPLNISELFAVSLLNSIFAGLTLLWYQAISWLNDSFVNGVKAPPLLVTRGPYFLVRHPIYFAYVGVSGSVGANLLIFFFGSTYWWLFFFVILLIWLMVIKNLLARIFNEERLLKRGFGSEWEKYSKQTGMLFPSKRSLMKYLKEPFRNQ